MLTLGQAVAQHGAQGASINTPYECLERLGFTLRRGQLSMIAAGPGVGKSMLAQDLTMRLHMRSLYISSDTDSFTVAIRAGAKMSGHTQTEVEKGLTRPDLAPMYHDLLAKLWNVRFSFDCSTMEDVRDEVFAYATAYGEFPPGLIVIDNLANVVGGEDDYRGMREALTNMQILARQTGSHVMVLHHATGRYEDGTEPIPLSGLENKVGKFPAQVLTLTREGARLGVHVVKNRGGKADAKGGYSTALYVDLARMQFQG